MQESRTLIHKQVLSVKLGKQDFHYDREEVFELVTEKQKQNQIQTKLETERQIQSLRGSTQATTQAIQDQTEVLQDQTNSIQHSTNIHNEILQKSTKTEYKNMMKLQNRNNHLLTKLGNFYQVDSTNIKTVSNLLNCKSQFS